MGFLKKVLDQIAVSNEFNKRVKKDKQALEESEQYLLNKMELLSNNKSLSFDNAMSVFKEVAENKILEHLFDEYPDLMERNKYYFTHSSKFKFIFKYTVEAISTEEEVMVMAGYLASNRIIRKLEIEDESASAVIASLTAMSIKCPLENKLKLYSIFDSSGSISAGYKTGASFMNGQYIISAFKDVETEKALAVLKYSESWLNLEKDEGLVNQLIDGDERLLPAIHYTKKGSK